jgi:hypothetical protein
VLKSGAPLDSMGALLVDMNGLIGAIQSGKPLPIVSSGLRLVNSQVNPVVGSTQVLNNQPLFTTTAVAGAVGSLYGLYNTFQNGGTALEKISASAGTISAVNSAYNAVSSQVAGQATVEVASGTLGAVSAAVPWLSAAVALQNGDYAGAAAGVAAAMGFPVVGWIYAAYSIVKALNATTPEAWGTTKFKFSDGTSLSLETVGESFGISKVALLAEGNGQSVTNADGTPNSNYFGGLLGYLNGIVAQQAQAYPNDLLGIIPQRLPTITWREARQGDAGYAIVDVDPITASERNPGLRYGDDWKPYNADPTDPKQRQNVFERLVNSALERNAIAPMWEVRTARLQQDAGDPNAGLTEEERAARQGLGATVAAGSNNLQPGVFRPVTLDLDGDGRITTVSLADNGRVFNWDGSGFDKRVGWIGNNDAMLYLDRSPNGVVDSGKELFSNSAVSDVVKGVRGLAWVDANSDGLITNKDPVFAELKVWQDTNGNALADEGELKTLAQLGITELDYNNNRFTRDGQLRSLQSTALETSLTGQRVSNVPGGIKIEFQDGSVQIRPTRVTDASQVPRVESVNASSTLEGYDMYFTVLLNVAATTPTVVNLSLQGGTANAISDFAGMEVSLDNGANYVAAAGGALTVPVGTKRLEVRVRTIRDNIIEPTETFSLRASTSANDAPVIGSANLVDANGFADVSIFGPSTVTESEGSLTYTVRLSSASATPISVSYATVGGSAAAGGRFRRRFRYPDLCSG